VGRPRPSGIAPNGLSKHRGARGGRAIPDSTLPEEVTGSLARADEVLDLFLERMAFAKAGEWETVLADVITRHALH